MLKKVCDCCSKDVNVETKYKLPNYIEVGAYNKGIKTVSFTDLKDVDMDLCDECIMMIASFISAIKQNNKDVGNVSKDIYHSTVKRNPFYDDTYSILYEFDDGRKEERKLVEFSEIELLEIRYMIDKLLSDTGNIDV